MAITERLALIIDADGKGAISELEKVGKTAEREIGRAESNLDKWGSKMTNVGATMAAGAAVVGVALWDAASATSDLNEAADYSSRVFGEASGQIEQFAESAEDIGLSKRAAHEATTTFADLLKATKASKDELAGMSIEMTQLASDMASAKNTSPEEAVEALGAALRGESEPIRNYGVLLDEATLKQRALDMGLVETTKGTLPIAIKMQAAYAEILAQSAGMQDNYADTVGGAANQQRNMLAAVENGKVVVGEKFLPVMAQMVSIVRSGADGFEWADKATGGAVGSLAAYGTVAAGVGGTLAVAGGQAISLANAFKSTAFASTAAGTAMTAAMGPAAVAIAALTASYLVFQAKVNQSDGAMDAMLSQIDSATSGATTAADLYRTEAALVEEHNSLVDASAKGIDFWNNAEAQAYADATHETGKRVEATQSLIAIMEGLSAETGESKDATTRWLLAQMATGTVFKDTENALAIYNAQMNATGKAAESTSLAQAELNKRLEDARGELDKAVTAVQRYFDSLDGELNAQLAWEAAIDGMTSTLSENGLAWDWVNNKLDITTAAGRENLAAFQEQADAARLFGENMLTAGVAPEIAAQATLDYVEALKLQWRQAGYTEEQVGILIAQMHLTPTEISTGFNAPGLTELQAAVSNYSNVVSSLQRHVVTTIDVVLGGGSFVGNALAGVPRRARGGAAFGATIVGEEGPELAFFGQQAQVVPARETAEILSGRGAATAPPVVNVFIGNEQVQAKVEHGLLSNKRARRGWSGVKP